MDSAVCEIASSVPAQALVEPKTRPPNAAATPTIACRRVGTLTTSPRLFLSLIIPSTFSLPLRVTRGDRITPRPQNMFNIMFYWQRNTVRGILQHQTDRRPHALPCRSSPGSKEKHH